jgi:hypothetical protein
MKANPQKPVFSTKEYVRPNLDWECGRLCEGCPCRIGPTPSGQCRATYECTPRLDTKPGEVKGHWSCTRPRSGGGKCETGPLPDGTCCKAIPKCQPTRTLRLIRKRLVLFTVIGSLFILLVGIGNPWRDAFTNPGPISSVHASATFSEIHTKISGERTSNCAACHDGVKEGVESWHHKAVEAFLGGLTPANLLKKGPVEASLMDKNCLSCHQGKNLHQPNMATTFACQECHKEHMTSGFMLEVESQSCTACHGSSEIMAASGEIGRSMSPHAFPGLISSDDSRVATRKRPEKGYTQVITAFHKDHPEFQQIREGTKDESSLKFNHAVHLKTGSMPRTLNCSDCHERDAKGEYQKPITYEAHCIECHTLQFDPETTAEAGKPGIYLPHGDPYYVRAFLRSLNIQYEEYARTHEGISSRDELSAYVKEKKVGIEKLYVTGENLERSVFFANMKGGTPGGLRAPYAGCATCHEVSEPVNANATPIIKKVSPPDRWMTLGKFNHDLHQKGLSCLDCHQVMTSELTSDLNLPSIKSCVECHSPQGGIDHRCTSCHTYHNEITNLPKTHSDAETINKK